MTPPEVARVFEPPASRREVADMWARLLAYLDCAPRPVAWVERPTLAALYAGQTTLRWLDGEWDTRFARLLEGSDGRSGSVYVGTSLGRSAALAAWRVIAPLGWEAAWRTVGAVPFQPGKSRDESLNLSELSSVAARAALWQSTENPWVWLLRVLRGAGRVWVMGDEVVCVPHPEVRLDQEGRLHAEPGPAVSWDEENYWFWHGTRVPRWVIEQPDRIIVGRVMEERNAQVRRAMIERMTVERFVAQASAEMVDRDTDAGGERTLRRIPLPWDESVTALVVKCPSTQAIYVLRVPPTMRTCREAAAWTFGYDSAEVYSPAAET